MQKTTKDAEVEDAEEDAQDKGALHYGGRVPFSIDGWLHGLVSQGPSAQSLFRAEVAYPCIRGQHSVHRVG